MKCKCPNCGMGLEIKLSLSPTTTTDAPIIGSTRVTKFNTKSDAGKFRQALSDVGFINTANTAVFSDTRKATGDRRLKLWFGDVIANATAMQRSMLEIALRGYFGDRFVSCGVYHNTGTGRFGQNWDSYVVHLKPKQI